MAFQDQLAPLLPAIIESISSCLSGFIMPVCSPKFLNGELQESEPSSSTALTPAEKERPFFISAESRYPWENKDYSPIPPDLARAHADKVIARMERMRKPGDTYDSAPKTIFMEFQNDRRTNRRVVALGGDGQPEEGEEDGVRIATLAFFTMMALMGFLCTYLLVYVVEPMTRKEEEILRQNAKHAEL